MGHVGKAVQERSLQILHTPLCDARRQELHSRPYEKNQLSTLQAFCDCAEATSTASELRGVLHEAFCSSDLEG